MENQLRIAPNFGGNLGYYSQSNIHELLEQGIDFLTRLPAGRVIYKDILTEHTHDVEHLKMHIQFGKRGHTSIAWGAGIVSGFNFTKISWRSSSFNSRSV